MKNDLLKKQMAAEAADDSASPSTEDQLKGGEGSKKGEDNPVRPHRTRRVEGGKGKAVAEDFRKGEMSIRHRCAFDSICAFTNDLVEIQKDANHVGAGLAVQGLCDGPIYGRSTY